MSREYFPTSLQVQIDGILFHLDTKFLFLISRPLVSRQILRNSLVDRMILLKLPTPRILEDLENVLKAHGLAKESDSKWFTDYIC